MLKKWDETKKQEKLPVRLTEIGWASAVFESSSWQLGIGVDD